MSSGSIIDIPLEIPFEELDGRKKPLDEFMVIGRAVCREIEARRDPAPFIEKAIRELTEKHRAEERLSSGCGA